MAHGSYAAIAAAGKVLGRAQATQTPSLNHLQTMSTSLVSETKPDCTQPRRAFVSGPLAPTPDYFSKYYEPRLLAALSAGDSFILGPSRGIDTLALAFLRRKCKPSRLSVYFTTSEYHRTCARLRRELEDAGIRTVAAGRNHTERDEAMTKASDYDILRYLTKSECIDMFGSRYRERVSGTELNEMRRVALSGVTSTDNPCHSTD
jgi:hypothetical protein